MSVTTETATVYRGGGRRWFSLKAACNAEAWAIMRRRDKPRCECEQADIDYINGVSHLLSPPYTCRLHEHDRLGKRHRRLVRLIRAAIAAKEG